MDNSNENIKSLLDKYWAGDTSLEEETALVKYFNQPHVDEAFKPFQQIFNYFEEERSTTIDLEDQIMAKVQQKTAEPKIISFPWRRMIAIAASVLLIVTIGVRSYQLNKLRQQKELAMVDTFQTPEEALAQTKAALLYLSSRMNKATDKATKSITKTENLNILN